MRHGHKIVHSSKQGESSDCEHIHVQVDVHALQGTNLTPEPCQVPTSTRNRPTKRHDRKTSMAIANGCDGSHPISHLRIAQEALGVSTQNANATIPPQAAAPQGQIRTGMASRWRRWARPTVAEEAPPYPHINQGTRTRAAAKGWLPLQSASPPRTVDANVCQRPNAASASASAASWSPSSL